MGTPSTSTVVVRCSGVVGVSVFVISGTLYKGP
jgi:hypothetical protein